MSTLFVDTINEKTSGNGVQIPGHPIQIVTADIGGAAVTTTSTSSVTSNKSATITPKYSNSKIIIHVTLGDVANTNCHAGTGIAIRRGTTLLANLTSRHVYNAPGGGVANGLGIAGFTGVWFDSPSTTSATTYTVYFDNGGAGTATLFRDNTDGCIILTEVAQ